MVSVHTYSDGDRYVGEWVQCRMQGKGTYYYKNGDKYEGMWHNDKRNGYGVVTYVVDDGRTVAER